ncbi:MAG: SDR family NAD(P)-dependent oxidoreductase [Candidatus Lokiarchaeota archaeon]|nr:SDR family NAD(P)-dependent oxidoreductase [Candidatus Lokiarchaeota archaeon]
MKAAVTGANGFIGSYLCRCLASKGAEVHAMVRKTSDLSLLEELNPGLKGIVLEYGDVTDVASLKKAFSGMDVVFNTAGVLKGFKQVDYDRVNVDGYKNVCEALLEVNPRLQRLVMFSSMAAAGPSQPGRPMQEDDEPRPLEGDLYGVSKWRMEQAIKPYMDKLPITMVRPPFVAGGGDVPSLDLFKAVKNGFKTLVGKGEKLYSLLDVDDLCEGVYLVATRPEAVGQVFYFASGDPIDWGAVQDLIARAIFNRQKPLRTLALSPKGAIFFASLMEFFGKITGKTPFLNKSKMIEGGGSGWAVSAEKAKKLLGWQPRQTVESTLQNAAKWYVDHGWLKL